jgi:hypothetical protein
MGGETYYGRQCGLIFTSGKYFADFEVLTADIFELCGVFLYTTTLYNEI